MTSKEKLARIVELLYKRTFTKGVEWKSDEQGPYCYMGNRFIHLSVGRNADGEPLEKVEIRTAMGETLENFNDEFFQALRPNGSSFANYYLLMNNLREMAHRQAIGADEAIDDILAALDEGDDN